MQLEQIGRKDIIEQVGKVDGKATTTDATQSEQKIAKGKLRSISVNNPFYNKNDLKEKTMAEKMEEQLAQGTDASLLHNQMAVYAQTTSWTRTTKKCRRRDFLLCIWKHTPL